MLATFECNTNHKVLTTHELKKQIESTLTTFVHNPRPNKEPMDKNIG